MPAPAFIVGCGRSGTTLVSAILDAHPDVDVPLATGLYGTYGDYVPVPGVDRQASRRHWRRLVELLVSDVGVRSWQYPPAVADIGAAVEDRSFGNAFRLLHEYHARQAGKPLWVAKSIQSVLCLPRVYRDFPDARFVNCIRDGRDVALSLLRNDFGPVDISGAAHYWQRHVQAWQQALGFLPPEQAFSLHFEALIRDPEREIRALLAFLGVPYHQGCVNFFQSGRSRALKAEGLVAAQLAAAALPYVSDPVRAIQYCCDLPVRVIGQHALSAGVVSRRVSGATGLFQ